MKNWILIWSICGFLSSVAFAQDLSYQQALKDQSTLQSQINSMSKRTKRRSACVVHQLNAQLKSNQWFLDHYSHYQELFQRVKSSLLSVQRVVRVVDANPITVLPVQSNAKKSEEVKLTFSDLVEYFHRYNEKTVSSLDVAHSQVVAAMESVAKLMNASFREPDAVYALKFFQVGKSYRLMLSVKFLDQSIPELKISLLSEPMLSDAAIWSALGTGEFEGVPRDAAMRLNHFLRSEDSRCRDDLALNVATIEKSPYLSADELFAKVEKIKKSDQSIGAMVTHMQNEVNEFEKSSDHELIIAKIAHLQQDVIQIKIFMKHPPRDLHRWQIEEMKPLLSQLQRMTDSEMQLYR